MSNDPPIIDLVLDCKEEHCPLLQWGETQAKFCSLCGSKAEDKLKEVTQEPEIPICSHCKAPIPDPERIRFCTECGTPTKSVQKLLDSHSKPTGPTPEGTRGLTEEEMTRIHARMQTAAPTAPEALPDAEWERELSSPRDMAVQPYLKSIMPRGHGRTATQSIEGNPSPGFLSRGKLPVDYHQHVRVIPYRFNTPAYSQRQMVGRPGSCPHCSVQPCICDKDQP